MLEFYRGKRVLVTGHTGFKGTWLCQMLSMAGAEIVGYALTTSAEENLYEVSGIEKKITSVIGDIRDFSSLNQVFEKYSPEIVFHLAAQPLVRESYRNPLYTYETNVMGTVNVLECARMHPCVKSVLNVTTDKVYENKEWEWGYRENDPLDGYDPYSNSKSCSELVTHSYRKSFFQDMDVCVSTARAGNVIGGGDFAKDRIIPDCVRAALKKEPVLVRNPYSVRPFQHVIEPLAAYLLIAQRQCEDRNLQGYYNVGPAEQDCVTAGKLVDLFCNAWGEGMTWKNLSDGGPHEATFLKLDCSKIKSRMKWHPIWNIETAVQKTTIWTKAYRAGESVSGIMEQQIQEYMEQTDW